MASCLPSALLLERRRVATAGHLAMRLAGWARSWLWGGRMRRWESAILKGKKKRSRAAYCPASAVYILTFHSVFTSIENASNVDAKARSLRVRYCTVVGDGRSIETFCSSFSDADAPAWVTGTGLVSTPLTCISQCKVKKSCGAKQEFSLMTCCLIGPAMRVIRDESRDKRISPSPLFAALQVLGPRFCLGRLPCQKSVSSAVWESWLAGGRQN